MSKKLYKTSSEFLSICQSAYEYESISSNNRQKDNKYIGICSETINKNNNEYIVEWHICKLKEASIIEAWQRLDDLLNKYSYSQNQIQQFNNELEINIENKYYLCILLGYKNNNQITYKKYQYNKNYTLLKIFFKKINNPSLLKVSLLFNVSSLNVLSLIFVSFKQFLILLIAFVNKSNVLKKLSFIFCLIFNFFNC